MNTELNKLHMEKVSRDKKKVLNDISNKNTSNSTLLKDNIKEKENSEIISAEQDITIKQEEGYKNISNEEINITIEQEEDSAVISDNIVETVKNKQKPRNSKNSNHNLIKENRIENTKEEYNFNDSMKRCRICYEEDESISELLFPCRCNGSIKWVHEKCIKEWISISGKNYCPQCKYTYLVKRTCNYPRLSFLSKERNIRFVSLFIMILLVLVIGLLKYFTIGIKDNSKVRFLLDGLKGLIIISIIIIPILYYKKWIDINSIYSEMYGNTVLMGSSIGDISGFIFLVINNILNKIVNKYIKFENKIQNYSV
jgi:rubrerythrin